ncbi:MAG: DNA alkylation repair protein [Bacteroidota bacterium]
MKTPEYVQPIEQAFKAKANRDEAIKMKKYMKGQFEFFGVKSPARKEIYREHKNKYGLIPVDKLEKIVIWCWQKPQREYQYFALEFLTRAAKNADEEIICLYEEIIITKSWWDTVDGIAANLVGPYFQKFPKKIKSFTTDWMKSGNMWLQRSCILYQLKYKNKTDTRLLHKFIEPLASSKEFFIRKAIGWILREYSKTNADFVINYVKKNKLSGLSEREALKWLSNQK